MEMAFHIPERNDGYYAYVYNFPFSFVIVMYLEKIKKNTQVSLCHRPGFWKRSFSSVCVYLSFVVSRES